MNNVVSSDGHGDDAKRVFVLNAELEDCVFEAIQRIVAGQGKVPVNEVGQHRLQTLPLHVSELVFWILYEAVEISHAR